MIFCFFLVSFYNVILATHQAVPVANHRNTITAAFAQAIWWARSVISPPFLSVNYLWLVAKISTLRTSLKALSSLWADDWAVTSGCAHQRLHRLRLSIRLLLRCNLAQQFTVRTDFTCSSHLLMTRHVNICRQPTCYRIYSSIIRLRAFFRNFGWSYLTRLVTDVFTLYKMMFWHPFMRWNPSDAAAKLTIVWWHLQ